VVLEPRQSEFHDTVSLGVIPAPRRENRDRDGIERVDDPGSAAPSGMTAV
jgi:hypothetical protein